MDASLPPPPTPGNHSGTAPASKGLQADEHPYTRSCRTMTRAQVPPGLAMKNVWEGISSLFGSPGGGYSERGKAV